MSRRAAALTLLGLLAVPATGCASWSAPVMQPEPAAPAPSVSHRVTASWLPVSVARFAPLMEQASWRHRIDANLVAIVVLVESGGDPSAISPAGAIGLMQLMPATARDVARRLGITNHQDGMLLDPGYNIELGSWYLGRQVEAFWAGDPDVTVERAAAAYNGGPGRLSRHLTQGAELPAETVRYQRWVGGMWRERGWSASETYSAWWRAGGERLVVGAWPAALVVGKR